MHEIYEVLEQQSGGLRLQIEYQPKVNSSLLASHVPFIRALVVHNETGRDLGGIRLKAELTVIGESTAEWTHRLPGPVSAGSVTRLDDPAQFAVFAPLLSSAREAMPASLGVALAVDDGAESVGPRMLAAIEVSAHNEWLNRPGLHASIATFVQPNAEAVTEILRSASDLLLKKTDSGSLDGYQRGSDRAHQIAGAIYESLRASGVDYVNPPASFEATGQKVRTTEQVLRDHFGTCIDLSVTYAACLEAAGLFPVIFLTADHAFPGYYATERWGDAATIDSANAMTNLVEIGAVQPVEMTGIGPGSNSLLYRAAAKRGTDYFREQFDRLRTMVDVSRARLDGIRPMHGFAGDGRADVKDDGAIAQARPFVAQSSLKSLTAIAEEEVIRGVLERRDDSPARFKTWKRDLLDLSLRNPLLNMPHSLKVLDLVMPGGMLAALDDVIHAGKSVRLLGGVESSELQKLAGARVANEIAPEIMTTLFSTTKSVFSNRDEDRHRLQLRAMKREADTLEQETGSNYLFLTLGTLVHPKPNGGEARAPLFLLPVRITGGLSFSPYSFKLDGDDIAQPNLCLLEWLRSTKGLNLEELENPAVDDSGIAISTVFAGIRERLVEAGLPFRVDETASLAILKFSTFQIWKDLDTNWRALVGNPVVEHLVERPGESFEQASDTAAAVDEAQLLLPIAADGSQMSAVVRASRGESFVLEGPPGTGKSQTITNLIAHALQQGKKVLFVAEKQAALEVVKRRLDAVGVGGFALELHGAKQSMKSIRDQLKRSLESSAKVDESRWANVRGRLASALGALTEYPDRVHSVNAVGQSLWSAYDAVLEFGDGPVADIPAAQVGSLDGDNIRDLTADYASAAGRLGITRGHHWLLSGITSSESVDVDALRAGLDELAAVRRRVDELGSTWREALSQTVPSGSLDAVVRLLTARSNGVLPEPSHLGDIDRPSWRERADAARGVLTAYLQQHSVVLADLSPDLIASPQLSEWITRSLELDKSWFFREMRRRSLVEQVTPEVRDGLDISKDRFTRTLIAARRVQDEAVPLAAEISQIPGLRLPEDWSPYRPGARDVFEAAVGAATDAVWLDKHAPKAWAALADTNAGDEAALRDLQQGWSRWLQALAADVSTFQHWRADRDWVTAWDADAARWRSDLDSSGALQLQRFAESRRLIAGIRTAGLSAFADQLASVEIAPHEASEALLRGLAVSSLTERAVTTGLDAFDADAQDRAAESYLANSAAARELLTEVGPAQLIAQRPFRVGALRGEVAELARQIERKRGGLSFREITRRYPDALLSITPCFLMSPGSVAHYLDPENLEFDLVVFDEASQIRVSQAIGAMGRGRSVVVVGDSRQMPPTRVMQVEASAAAPASPDELVVEDLESILTESVESGLPQLWLEWHYRSRDESLIAFSNANYYGSRLVSLPAPGDDPAAGVGWRRIDGHFDRGASRTNDAEARAIVDEIRARLRNPATKGESIGVVCFNIQQRDLILNMLEESGDLLVQQALTAEPGNDLFVKNLENVQGDERDVILFSLAFSVDQKTGILPLNFGPLNLPGGERRLNVAITRARKQIVLFSSFDPTDIDLRRSNAQGIRDLRGYLEYAATRRLEQRSIVDAQFSNRGRFLEEVAESLRAEGLEVAPDLGLSAFRVDLAVKRPSDPEWRVAVMLDGPGWRSRPTVADRDGAPGLLTNVMGWQATARVWLPGWIRDKASVVSRIKELVERPAQELPIETTADVELEPLAEKPAVAYSSVDIEDSDLTVIPFVPAPDTAIANQSVLENMAMALPAILRMATEALSVEGPTHFDRLVTIVARRFGYRRMGEAKRAELEKTIAANFHTDDFRFVWPAGIDQNQWRGIRRTTDSAHRTLGEVSPAEIANAMELVLRESFSSTRDDLLREAAATLGYSRMTESAKKWLGSALDSAVDSGRFSTSDGRMRIG